MKHWNWTRLTALALALGLPLTCLVPASAAEVTPEKQEIIYVNLNTDGSLSDAYAVNLFDLEQAGTVVDYGDYTSVRNMTSTEPVDYQGNQVTVDASAGKLYYEGALSQVELPWTFALTYTLDGKACTGEELAGQSGALEIHMSVRQNPACDQVFFDQLALQISFTLDTDHATQIQAEGATVANVGQDKQLTYTVLPGKETDFTIQAQVTDFEMDAVSINGLPLSLDVEVDDEELMDQVTELLDAIEDLDDGAQELNDGTAELKDGAEGELSDGVEELRDGAQQLHSGAGDLRDGGSDLQSGAGDLQEGAAQLDSGLNELNQGISQVEDGLTALNEQSGSLTGGSQQVKDALGQIQAALDSVSATGDELQVLLDSSSEIRGGIDALSTGTQQLYDSVSFQGYVAAMAENGLDIHQLQEGNAEAIRSINDLLGQVEGLENRLTQMGVPSSFLAPLKNQGVSLANQIVELLQGNQASIQGTEAYLNQVSANLETLADGAADLQANYAAFDDAIGTLVDSLSDLLVQVSILSDAIDTLVEEYGALDSGLNSYTDGVAQVLTGYQQIAGGAAELAEGSGALKSGSTELYDGTAQLLGGIVELYDATGTLRDGTGELDDGVAELLAGIVELYDGTEALKDGTGEMRDETEGMDTDIQDQIDELLESIQGSGEPIPSFLSEENGEIQSLQFVMQTAAIEKPEQTEVSEEPVAPTIWEKFIDLFNV